MTIWRAGMLAACIKRGQWENVFFVSGGPDPRYGQVLRVERAAAHPNTGEMCLWFAGYDVCGYIADRFRPLNDAPDDTALIEKIKRCKPVRKPVDA